MNPVVEILINIVVGILLFIIFFILPTVFIYVSIKHRKEINEEAAKKAEERRKRNIKKYGAGLRIGKHRYASFPLSLWND